MPDYVLVPFIPGKGAHCQVCPSFQAKGVHDLRNLHASLGESLYTSNTCLLPMLSVDPLTGKRVYGQFGICACKAL